MIPPSLQYPFDSLLTGHAHRDTPFLSIVPFTWSCTPRYSSPQLRSFCWYSPSWAPSCVCWSCTHRYPSSSVHKPSPADHARIVTPQAGSPNPLPLIMHASLPLKQCLQTLPRWSCTHRYPSSSNNTPMTPLCWKYTPQCHSYSVSCWSCMPHYGFPLLYLLTFFILLVMHTALLLIQ